MRSIFKSVSMLGFAGIVMLSSGAQAQVQYIPPNPQICNADPRTFQLTYDNSGDVLDDWILSGAEVKNRKNGCSTGYITGGRTGVGQDAQNYIVYFDRTGSAVWEIVRPTTTRNDEVRSIVQTFNPNNGRATGFISAGRINEDIIARTETAYLIRLDEAGVLQWERVLPLSYVSPKTSANVIQQTDDGGYIVGGNVGVFNRTSSHPEAYLIKLDRNANVQWEQYYEDLNATSDRSNVQDIKELDDGYIVVGGHRVWDGTYYDAWAIRTDDQGFVIWETILGTSGPDGFLTVELTDDGGFLAAGFQDDIGASGVKKDLWLVKLDASGGVVWETVHVGTRSDDDQIFPYDIERITSGDYVLTGDHSFATGPSTRNVNAYFAIFDADGVLVRERDYGGSAWDISRFVNQTPDEGFIMGGSTLSFGNSSRDFYLIKTDEMGNQ